MTSPEGHTFWIDITFDDVTIRVTGLAWQNTDPVKKAQVILSQPGKPTITRLVAAQGATPGQGEVASAGSVNVPTTAGGYTYDPTGDDVNAAQLASAWF